MAGARERRLQRLLMVGVAALLAACGSSNTEEIITAPAPNISPAAARSVTDAEGHALPGARLTVIAPLGVSLRDADAVAGASSLGSLVQGTVVTVVAHSARNGGWYQVRTGDGTGWITDDPAYSTTARLTLYQSNEHGFTALYPQEWTFVEHPASVGFGPADASVPPLTVSVGPTLGALGPPGRASYGAASSQTIEVYGITTMLRVYDRAGSPAGGSAGQPAHLAEILVTATRSRAMRLDYLYSSEADLRLFEDFYDSIIVPGAP